jgi:hypothetical protein
MREVFKILVEGIASLLHGMAGVLDRVKPQVFIAMASIATLAGLIIVVAPAYIGEIVGGAITGIGMLGMKLLEKTETS